MDRKVHPRVRLHVCANEVRTAPHGVYARRCESRQMMTGFTSVHVKVDKFAGIDSWYVVRTFE